MYSLILLMFLNFLYTNVLTKANTLSLISENVTWESSIRWKPLDKNLDKITNVFNHDNYTQNIHDLKNKIFKSFFHSLIYSCVKKNMINGRQKTKMYILLSCGLVIKGHNSDREICDVEITRPSSWNCQLQKSFLKIQLQEYL